MTIDPLTPFLGLIKPVVNDEAGEDLWGDKLNGNSDTLDANASTMAGQITALQSGKLGDGPHDGKTYGRRDGTWFDVATTLTIDWANITGKPATYPPSAHTHAESEVTGLIADLANLQSQINANTTGIAGKEPIIATGNPAYVWRGDKTWQALPAAEPPIAAGNPAYFWRGDKTWQPVPPAGVPEAPNDGQQYARKSLGWAVVTGAGGGIPEAPLDGASYARQGSTGTWTALPAQVTWSTLTGKPATFPPTLPIAQTDVTGLTAALAGKEPSIGAGTTGQYWRGDKAWTVLDKIAVGLGNVDNTSDVNKPVSTAQATSIATKEPALPAGGTVSNFLRGDKTWQPVPAAGAKITTGTSAPGSPADNDLWFNPDLVALFIRYNDGTSTQWMQIG